MRVRENRIAGGDAREEEGRKGVGRCVIERGMKRKKGRQEREKALLERISVAVVQL